MNEGLLILAALYALPPSEAEPPSPPVTVVRPDVPPAVFDPFEETQVDRAPLELSDALFALSGRRVEEVWARIHELAPAAATTDADALTEFVNRADFLALPTATRFAAAVLARTALRRKPTLDRALAALLKLARGDGATKVDPFQIDAIRVLGEAREIDSVRPVLMRVLAWSMEARLSRVQIATVLALDRLDSTTSRRPVIFLLNDPGQSFEIRAEAALALAQMSPTETLDPLVVPFLRTLAREPSERGTFARLLLDRLALSDGRAPDLVRRLEDLENENATLRERVEKIGIGGPGRGDAISEMISLIRQNFVDPGAVDTQELAIEAFRALAARLDHVRFLAPSDLARRRSSVLGSHLGLGAEFFKFDRSSPLVVVKRKRNALGEITNGQLRAGDRVVAIDGVATAGRSASDIRGILASREAGDLVHLDVQRHGWDRPRSLDIAMGTTTTSTVEERLFPRGIAYVRLTAFAKSTATELTDAIARLEKAEGDALDGLILDLRGNVGGLLDQAVKVVDLLVADDGVPIVTREDANGRPAHEYFPENGQLLTCPVVVVIDGNTLSSAEVVAGALQDLQRARVVGRRSFGKGVSQQRYDAPRSVRELVGGEAEVLLPNSVLRLPSGRGFHTPRDSRGRPLPGLLGGIVPDVEIRQLEDELESWQLDEMLRVQYSVELSRFLRGRLDELRRAWSEEPQDLLDSRHYSGLSTTVDALDSRLEPRLARVALRRLFRDHLEDEHGAVPLSVVFEDPQLIGALKALGVDRTSSPEYAKWLPSRTSRE